MSMRQFSDWPKNLREAVFLLGVLLLAYVLLSLFSYSTSDPSPLTTAGDAHTTENLGGIAGASLAAVLFSLFGRSAYLLCFVVVLFWRGIWLRHNPLDMHSIGKWLTAVGVILCIISSAAIEYLRFHYSDGLPAGAGGLIGRFTGHSMMSVFGMFGASLLLFAIWLFSWSLVMSLSWYAFSEQIGAFCERLLRIIFRFFQAAWRRHIARRQSRRLAAASAAAAAAAAAVVKAAEPIISTAKPGLLAITKPLRKGRSLESKKAPEIKITPTLVSPAAEVASAKTVAGKKPVDKDDPLATAPTIQLLDAAATDAGQPEELLDSTAALIEKSLASFNVTAKVAQYHPGPIVTRYDLQPATGVKGVQIVNLARDLARALAVEAIRVLETIPGTNYIGLEIPNQKRASVNLSEVLSSNAYRESEVALPLALGKTAVGNAAIADLSGMPHMLVAGSTGSGKSVFINALLLSLLFCRTPKQLRFLLIDPKMLELASYADIPHLLAPVVTDMELAPAALHWAIGEMERRYRLMADAGVRHIGSYNDSIDEVDKLPYIVIIIDELADLMMTSGKKVELSISRLAQKARAAGIHMVLATQRPSVDVITGLIKANIPCRLSFQVASKVDSRTVLDQGGAESLLGKGDMLYLPSGSGLPQRLHGAFVSDDEVRRVVEHIRSSNSDVEYLIDFATTPVEPSLSGGDSGVGNHEEDALYDEAVSFVVQSQRVSISMVQRRLRIGYNRAARIVENMEQAGLVTSMNELGARKVLVPKRD